MPTMTVHGCPLFYEDSGGPGPPVLLLHGLLFDGRMFDQQVAALRGQYRCIRMDFRGQGRSAPATHGYQVEQQTADVLALLRGLHVDAAHLVGLSMGGYVAMRIAARHPDTVLSLTLLNTGAGAHPVRKYPEHLALASLARVLGPSHPRVARAIEASMYGQPFRTDPGSADLRRQWRERWARSHVASVLHTVAGIVKRPDLHAELSDITAPTLVITGSQDTHHPPADAHRIVEQIPGSTSLELAGVGHSTSIEAPADVTTAIQHLLETAPSHASGRG